MKIRFAPSPTGLFHVGNLRTAFISWRLSEVADVPLHLRFEDIDTARSSTEFAETQLQDLNDFGIFPHEISYQREFHGQHFQAFEKALKLGDIYPCFCSRREVLGDLQRAPNFSGASDGIALRLHQPSVEYSGKCRSLNWDPADFDKTLKKYPQGWGWRFRSKKDSGGLRDFLVARTLGTGSGEWCPAYNWACAWDDFALGPCLLVRAWDLESSEEIQRELRYYWAESLRVSAAPRIFTYFTSLVTTESGKRLEKRDRQLTFREIKGKISIDKIRASFERSWHEPLEGLVPKLGMIRESFGESSKIISINKLFDKLFDELFRKSSGEKF